MSQHDDFPTELIRSEQLSPAPSLALAGLLDVCPPEGVLPLLWHWLYTLERPDQKDLGADGHPFRGVIPAPPGPGRRRMWAGGSVTSFAPLRFGETITRRTRLVQEVIKEGSSGTMTFAMVEHEISANDVVAIQERQDIVYRDAPQVATAPAPSFESATPPRLLEEGEWEIPIDPVVLFRFSALTYNAHRIHYDRDYASDVEGYPGLVTHGPLQAIAMAEAARRNGVDASVGHRLDYRLVSPLFDHQGLVTSHVPGPDGAMKLSIRDRSGRRTATARLAAHD